MNRIAWIIVFGAACYGFGALSVTADELFGIAQFYGPSGLYFFPHHRPERALGLMGLRIHRFSSLPLPLTRLASEAPAAGATLAGTILVRATCSSAQLSKELDHDENPEHCPGSSRKISWRACLRSSRLHDEAVLSEVSVVGKGVLDSVEIHKGEASAVGETVPLVPVSLEYPPSLPLNCGFYPQNPYHAGSLQIFSK